MRLNAPSSCLGRRLSTSPHVSRRRCCRSFDGGWHSGPTSCSRSVWLCATADTELAWNVLPWWLSMPVAQTLEL
eukprot:144903-Chlamydomonas_euryale.AAC.4